LRQSVQSHESKLGTSSTLRVRETCQEIPPEYFDFISRTRVYLSTDTQRAPPCFTRNG
jgi:hypothetical protein